MKCSSVVMCLAVRDCKVAPYQIIYPAAGISYRFSREKL